MSDPQTLVRVTADHIADGVPHNCEKCPIALAVTDALSLAGVPVEVDALEITAYRPGEVWSATMPAIARAFLTHYDDAEPVAPFDFMVTWRVESYEQMVNRTIEGLS